MWEADRHGGSSRRVGQILYLHVVWTAGEHWAEGGLASGYVARIGSDIRIKKLFPSREEAEKAVEILARRLLTQALESLK